MSQHQPTTFTAFEGQRRLASGSLDQVALLVRRAEQRAAERVAIFSDATGRAIDLDLRGSDANVITVVNTEFISNRQYGYFDDSGIGSNVLIATHAAANGLVSGAKPTQCTSAGNHYAAKVGGDFTVAPSGTSVLS